MENGREKARTSKVTAVMLMQCALLFGIRRHFHHRCLLTREAAALFPIIARACYFQVTLRCGDGVAPLWRGRAPPPHKQRLYGKIWDEDQLQLLGTDPRRTPQV